MMNPAGKVLVYASHETGGLAEHIYYQVRALTKAGAQVECLIAPAFLPGRPLGVLTKAVLAPAPSEGSTWAFRRIAQIRWLVLNQWRLAFEVWRQKPDLVLLESFVEYLSPFWVWPHWFLARFRGVRYIANLHDPVRNYQLGPRWWHQISVWLAYKPVYAVLIHDAPPNPSPVPDGIEAVQVPVGVYEVTTGGVSRERWREGHGIQPTQKVFLAFGFVRDGKNLDLVIKALPSHPDAVFVMAGSLQAVKERGFDYYRELAVRVGVGGRCRFIEGFIPDQEVEALFAAADFIVLTYSAEFHSQSGVLNIAARCRKLVLASSGPGPLCETVRRFGLGVAVEPDSLEQINLAIRRLEAEPPAPKWEEYEAFASWDANAAGILRAAGLRAVSTTGVNSVDQGNQTNENE